MLRQSLTAYAMPFCETVAPRPTPQGTKVLVHISRCGVCHSDVHMQDGYFKLSDDKRLDVTSGRTLPFTLGHEIAGIIESAGGDASDAEPGRSVAVYPWIGCGQCAACAVGDGCLLTNKACPRQPRVGRMRVKYRPVRPLRRSRLDQSASACRSACTDKS